MFSALRHFLALGPSVLLKDRMVLDVWQVCRKVIELCGNRVLEMSKCWRESDTHLSILLLSPPAPSRAVESTVLGLLTPFTRETDLFLFLRLLLRDWYGLILTFLFPSSFLLFHRHGFSASAPFHCRIDKVGQGETDYTWEL